ncbi:MAG: hypothetical protein RLO52_37400 [Sandaracinaceae bacterium]
MWNRTTLALLIAAALTSGCATLGAAHGRGSTLSSARHVVKSTGTKQATAGQALGARIGQMIESSPAITAARRAALEASLESGDLSVAQAFAARVSLGLDHEISAETTVQGAPLSLLAAAWRAYFRLGEPRLSEILQAIVDGGSEFGRAWSAYARRQSEVTALVRDHGTDLEALRAAISTVPPGERPALIAADAETPLIRAAASVAAEAGSYQALYELAEALRHRRAPGDEASERLLWVGIQRRAQFGGYFGGAVTPPIQQAGRHLEAKIQSLGAEPERLAVGLIHWTNDRVPVVQAGASDPSRGDWVRMELREADVGEDRVRMDYHDTWRVPYNCRRSRRVIGIDWETGDLRFAQDCRYRTERSDINVDARLATPSPEWARGEQDRVWVVGRVQRAGRRTRLRDAFVVDLRWYPTSTRR